MQAYNFGILNNGALSRFSLEIDNPQTETLEHLTSCLKQQQPIQNNYTTELMFKGVVIETNERLQSVLTKEIEGEDVIYFIARKILSLDSNSPSDKAEAIDQRPDLMQVFAEKVEKHSENVAVTYNGTALTYGELDQKSDQLAHFLTGHYQIEANIPIGMMGKDKLSLLICELALLKAGGAFVPFDPDIPKERLDFTLKNAGMKLMIACDEKSAALLKNDLAVSIPILDLKQEAEKISESTQTKIPLDHSKPSDLAYILYTSGSTASTPKGVMQTRNGLLGQMENYTENLAINSRDQLLQLATFTHDQAIVDTYGALLNGATLHLYDLNPETLNPEQLVSFIQEKKISIFSSIPNVFTLIFQKPAQEIPLGNDPNPFPHLRIVTLGGEAVNTKHVELYQKIAAPDCLFINGYGATEFSWVSYFVIQKTTSLDNLEQIPLGTMASGIEVYLDITHDNNSEGVGELCIHSPAMSPGYWNNQEATDKAFFSREGKLFYRTGDLVTKDEENTYHFKGRLAWHEKIAGKRINLKDVEDSMLKKFPLEECVVIAEGQENERKIYAFYTVKEGQNLDKTEADIRNELKDILKPHEIPFKFYPLETFPKLHNSKINRKKLVELIQQKKQEYADLIEPDQNIVDQFLSKILMIDLSSEKSINIFDYGASSMDVMRLTNLINTYFNDNGIEAVIEIKDIYEAITTDKIKQFVEGAILNHQANVSNIKETNHQHRQLAKKTAEVVEKPIYYYQNFPLLYVNSEHTNVLFNFASMEVLATYYKNKYNIDIFPCESQEQFFEKIDTFINSGKLGQIGLTWPINNLREAHPTPCVLSLNEEGGSLFISDSLGKCNFKQSDILKLENTYKLKVYVCPDSKQIDENSCSVLAISFLKDSLRLDMPSIIKILDKQKINNIEAYPENITFFQEPEELLKFYQKELTSLKIPVDENRPLRTSNKGTTLGEYRIKHKEKNLYRPHRNLLNKPIPENAPTITNDIHTASLKKGQKYKEIIKKHSEENS